MSLTNIERRKEMLRLRFEGATYEELAKEFNITRQRAHQIVNRPPSDYPQSRAKVAGKGLDKKLTGE